MEEQNNNSSPQAWLMLDASQAVEPALECKVVEFSGSNALFAGLNGGDWALISTPEGRLTRIGRILRIRSDRDSVTVYFDSVKVIEPAIQLRELGLAPLESGSVRRVDWDDFESVANKAVDGGIDSVLLIKEEAYIRELLQLAVTDDLLGPANGPDEQILDMGVRDRYLVGKLAPRQVDDDVGEGIEGLQGATATEEDEDVEPEGLEVHTGQHDPGAEFGSTTGASDPEADAADEIDASRNQSLVPSSFGMTFCVDGDVDSIKVEARWGRYERVPSEDHPHTKTVNRKLKDDDGNVTGTEPDEIKVKAWQRVPCGDARTLKLEEGPVSPFAVDAGNDRVLVQGTIRPKNENGDRLVTLFLVNTQEEPETNKDSAWVFQPELTVSANDDSDDSAIFRRRPLLDGEGVDEERDALEMIYRKQVEFAVGHGVSVHAETSPANLEQATEIRTRVMPQHEVPVTETPGLNPEDRSAMQKMVQEGFLDMYNLASLERIDLVAALSILTDDYGAWIEEQRARVGSDVVGHDGPAGEALQRCEVIRERLQEGIGILADEGNEIALEAFRFANRAMALQRIHSIYALARRRGEDVKVEDCNERKNRSWRPFQLAFVLLSIPSLADPKHKDRTTPIESDADLLWFPTGGGKTEAYLGVAAFTMAIRRMQGDLGGYDSSRGLAVIMRYTLRLLTLQQFQRATTLLCAMEVLRREAKEAGNNLLGNSPFTIGLWVGNKVTPGNTEESHKAIEKIRDSSKWDAGGTSPAQLTSCPWCGSEIKPGRHIDVNKKLKRTTLYCGDNRGRCEFSKAQSSQLIHPGLPVIVVDEELYHRPPSMMIATVDKFALMAWRGEARTLFGRATQACPRHGLLWPDSDCNGNHPAANGMPRAQVQDIRPIRPPDLIIQDEFHLISGPLGTMVGLYETAVDELSTWSFDDAAVRPKVIASTATVRKAQEQVNNVFMRRVAVFPPHGLDVEDNFFSVQRDIEKRPGRRYLGVCSPGSSRPAMLIRIYTAFLTASQELFDHFGQAADPYMTMVGYFNSLRELGGMKRLAEDDVQTRAYRVAMSLVERPGLAQRSVKNIRELTSRVSSSDIPKYLDQLEVKFKEEYDAEKGKFVTRWEQGEDRAVDVVLATNMLSVGVDVNRLGVMAVNGQPKGTAEYIQATSRVGRQFPGLVCTVLTWARPRDLSHYETFENYHATFYKHVEAQSVTPFSPRAMDRGLTGVLTSVVRLENDEFNPNSGASKLQGPEDSEMTEAIDVLADRAWSVMEQVESKERAVRMMKKRADIWANEAGKPGRELAYEKKGKKQDTTVALLKKPGLKSWDEQTVPMSMREVEPGVRLIMDTTKSSSPPPDWKPQSTDAGDAGDD